MLKLELSKKNKDITISLRKKDPFFNRTWWTALFLALFFHFFAFLIFKIHPFKVISEYIFPSVALEHFPASDIYSVISNKKASSGPDFPMPPLPTPNLGLKSNLFETIHEFPDHSFFINENVTKPFFFDVPSNHFKFLEYTPINLKISGNIASLENENTFIANLSKIKWLNKEGFLKYYHASYKVQVMPEIGRVFWYNQELSTGDEKLDKWIEEHLLPSLKFSENKSFNLTEGLIEITFMIDGSKTFNDLIEFL